MAYLQLETFSPVQYKHFLDHSRNSRRVECLKFSSPQDRSAGLNHKKVSCFWYVTSFPVPTWTERFHLCQRINCNGSDSKNATSVTEIKLCTIPCLPSLVILEGDATLCAMLALRITIWHRPLFQVWIWGCFCLSLIASTGAIAKTFHCIEE